MPAIESPIIGSPTIVSLSRDPEHHFSKKPVPQLTLPAGLGVEGDAHAGVTVRHRSRVRQDPTQPNLRQVHLISAELLEECRELGFAVQPADLGENVLTRGLDVLGLPRGTRLKLGETAVVEVTGLRNPCQQIDDFRPGLLKVMVQKGSDGQPVFRCGIMGIVLTGGEVQVGNQLGVEWPPQPWQKLERV